LVIKNEILRKISDIFLSKILKQSFSGKLISEIFNELGIDNVEYETELSKRLNSEVYQAYEERILKSVRKKLAENEDSKLLNRIKKKISKNRSVITSSIFDIRNDRKKNKKLREKRRDKKIKDSNDRPKKPKLSKKQKQKLLQSIREDKLLEELYTNLNSKSLKSLSKLLGVNIKTLIKVFKRNKASAKKPIAFSELKKIKEYAINRYSTQLIKIRKQDELYNPKLDLSRSGKSKRGKETVYDKILKSGPGKLISIAKKN